MVNITIPYEDFVKLKSDAEDRANVVSLLKANFPDDTCRIIAIKSILDIEDKKEESVEETPSETPGENEEPTENVPGDESEGD